MAQLALSDSTPDLLPHNGIDEAGARLEKAFARLKAAAQQSSKKQLSLKVDNKKLNALLHKAEEEVARLKAVAGTVSARLDHTIATLEQGSLPLQS